MYVYIYMNVTINKCIYIYIYIISKNNSLIVLTVSADGLNQLINPCDCIMIMANIVHKVA